MGWASHPDAISVKLRLDREAGHDPVRVARVVAAAHATAAADTPEARRVRDVR